MKRLIGLCELYDKALLSTIYDCALRVSEACSLKWDDISFDRQQVFVYQGKGKKDRCVPISEQQLAMLRCIQQQLNVPPVPSLFLRGQIHCALMYHFRHVLYHY